jgi:hypothetical protein
VWYTYVFSFIFSGAALALVTIILLTVYTAVQQSYRLSANDPQIQIAQNAVGVLNGGMVPQLLGSDRVNMRTSLAPFLMVFDQQGKVVGSSATLDDAVPSLPNGVLKEVSKKGEDRITWQPVAGVRIAAVIMKYNSGYVLSGRSLQEVERRETQLLLMIFAAWTVSVVVIYSSVYLMRMASPRVKSE